MGCKQPVSDSCSSPRWRFFLWCALSIETNLSQQGADWKRNGLTLFIFETHMKTTLENMCHGPTTVEMIMPKIRAILRVTRITQAPILRGEECWAHLYGWREDGLLNSNLSALLICPCCVLAAVVAGSTELLPRKSPAQLLKGGWTSQNHREQERELIYRYEQPNTSLSQGKL